MPIGFVSVSVLNAVHVAAHPTFAFRLRLPRPTPFRLSDTRDALTFAPMSFTCTCVTVPVPAGVGSKNVLLNDVDWHRYAPAAASHTREQPAPPPANVTRAVSTAGQLSPSTTYT